MEWYDNMKKRIYFLTLFVLFMAFTIKVNASTCSNERIIELSALANNVQVSYEPYDDETTYFNPLFEEEDTKVVPSFYITIYNLTDGLNAYVQRKDTNQTIVMTSDNTDTDGVVYIDTGEAYKTKTVDVLIRSDDSNCQDEILKSTTITLPMYNRFYFYKPCEENPEFEMCQEFTTNDYSNISDSMFSEKLNTYKEEKAEEERKQKSLWYKITSFLNKYKWIIIGIIAIIIAIVIIIIIRRKKSRLI